MTNRDETGRFIVKSIRTGKTSGETEAVFQVDKKLKAVGIGTDLAKTFGIKIIYFE